MSETQTGQIAMQTVFQWVLLVSVVASFFAAVHSDFNGRKAKEPQGFSGFVGSVIALVVAFGIYFAAGSFSEIFGSLE